MSPLFLLSALLFLITQLPLLATSIECDHPLTLSELVEIALENHPETQQAWWNARRAAAALGMAKSDFYPHIDATFNVQNGREFKFINGPDVNYTILGADLTLSYILFDFGTRKANVCAAKSALQAAGWENDWTLQSVMINVLTNAYSLLHIQDSLEATLISYKEAEIVYNASKDLNSAGLVPITDVYTSESAWIQMKLELVRQQNQLKIEKGNLAVSLGLTPLNSIEVAPVSLQEISFAPESIHELIELAYERRSDLLAERARLCESRFLQKKVRNSYKPSLSLTGYGGANHAIHDRANAGQYSILLNFDIPLFNGFETTYHNRMAYADTQLAKSALAELELEIAQEVLNHCYTLEAAEEMLKLAEANVLSAENAYKGVLEKYRAGKENVFDLSNAQRRLSEVRIQSSEIKAQFLIAIANLAYSTGTLKAERK